MFEGRMNTWIVSYTWQHDVEETKETCIAKLSNLSSISQNYPTYNIFSESKYRSSVKMNEYPGRWKNG